MAASSQFGVLKPLQRSKHRQPPLQGPQHQPHYGEFNFPPNPSPPIPSPSHQQQHLQHHHHHHHHQQLHQQQHGRIPTIATVPPTTTAPNYAPNGTIHPHLQSQSHHPVLNGLASGPPPPRQLQTMASIPANLSAIATAPAPIPATDRPDSQLSHPTAGRPSKRRRSSDNNDAEPVRARSPRVPGTPRPHHVHPFHKGPYETLKEAIYELQRHVFTSGYGVSQKRTVKEKLPSGKYDPDGDIIRKDFACDKGGNEFVSHSRGERRRESKKCGCPWKAAVRRLRREGDRWFIEILESNHNHPVTPPDDMHTLASYRRWQRDNNAGLRMVIDRLTYAASLPARDISAYLKGEFQDRDLDRIDEQILRALSMNDKELPGSEKESGSVGFEVLARRPVIILQDVDKTVTNGDPNRSNTPNNAPPAPMDDGSLPKDLAKTTTPTATTPPLNESPVTSRQTIPGNLINHSPNPPPAAPPSGSQVDGATDKG
ncbi:hypothetical protein F5B22DRAFT_175311 [Xylaria bambusicola]|uniref:uncharacterized protein n=1 Tax=Xylaria bambusicola TaxID=326684 RepID=UPI002007CCA0|nr:uncharacterized protein F5B22DRAFT_175311 [Xylaria bambusicola]KAI0526720.1 hypothetical protein F5B22DRAFT_175311 [Xylaria bambusicola]